MYDKLAVFYDNEYRTAFSMQVLETSKTLLAQHRIEPPGPVIDIACGTGILSLGLARAGWQVIAIDRSQGMLAIAQDRAEALGLDILFQTMDIREFTLETPVAAAFCYGDVVNHLLTLTDLQQLFCCVFRALIPGGLFVLDTNTLNTYQSRLWNLSNMRSKGAHFTMRLDASFDTQSGRGLLQTQVEERTRKGAQKTKEVLVEQYYTDAEIQTSLEQRGFIEVTAEPYNPVDLTPLAPEIKVLKTLWSCRKPA